MSGWEGWLIGISVILVACAFIALVIFLIIFLRSLRKTLLHTNQLLKDSDEVVRGVERKLHAVDPLFKAVADMGSILEKHTCCIKHHAEANLEKELEQKYEKVNERANIVTDVIEWSLLGVSLWQKFKEKRR